MKSIKYLVNKLPNFSSKTLLSNNTLSALALFHLIYFISYRKIFFICHECIIGHNWDWGFPASDFHFRRLFEISTSTWFSFNLGSGLFLNISHLIPNALISLAAYIFSPKYVIILLLYLVHFFSYFGFKKLLNNLVGENKLNLVSSLLYSFSPFLFNEIIGGSWYMWISFAAIPLFFNSLFNYIRSDSKKELTFFLISSIFVIPSLQNIVLIEAIFFLFIVLEFLRSPNKFRIFKRYIIAHVILFIFNLYWILPFLTSLFSILSYTSQSEFNGNFDSFTRLTQNIISILSISGYLDRNMYQFLYTGFGQKIWYLVIICAWYWLLYVIRVEKRIVPKRFWIFLFIFLASIMIVKGGLQPLSKLTLFIFRNIPLFSLYRSPQHLMLAPAFIIPLLFSFLLHEYRKKNIFGFYNIVTIIIFFWIGGWVITGDLGRQRLSLQKKDHVDFFRLSPNLKNVFEFNESIEDGVRTIFLPSVISPQYIETLYQRAAQGGQSEFILLRSPTLSAEINSTANVIDNYFCFKDKNPEIDLAKYLSLFNIKYLVLREDILPKFTECAEYGSWDTDVVKAKLENLVDQNIITSEILNVYSINEVYMTPKIFFANSVVYSQQAINMLPDLVSNISFTPQTVFIFQSQNKNKAIFRSTISKALINYQKISDTKYRISISNADDPLLLTFLDNYDSNWFITSINQKGWEYFFPKSLVSEDYHIIANGFSNAWILDPALLCETQIPCQRNADGSFNFEVNVEYAPQKIFYLGIISTLFTFIAYVIWIYNSKKS